MSKTSFVIITGLSGAGKSVALKTLEDLGFYTIDNLPVELLESFITLVKKGHIGFERAAMVMDSREKELFHRFPAVLDSLSKSGYEVNVVCLVASPEILQRRFSETRRVHPLDAHMPLSESISRESELMESIVNVSDLVLDTSDLSPHDLKAILRDRFSDPDREAGMLLTFISFGYKLGIPKESDLVFDVRFLPNPFFVNGLREKDGTCQEVIKYVEESPGTLDFIRGLGDFIEEMLPRYISEGRGYLTVAVGCTGGRHRSVVILQRLAERFRSSEQVNIQVRHRDIKEGG